MDNFNHHCPSLQLERMMGFGLPGHSNHGPRPLPYCMQGPLFFYFENVANVIDNSWNTMKLHFNGVEPKFVNSRYFSATWRQRGYVHNLSVQSRKFVLPPSPMTILTHPFLIIICEQKFRRIAMHHMSCHLNTICALDNPRLNNIFAYVQLHSSMAYCTQCLMHPHTLEIIFSFLMNNKVYGPPPTFDTKSFAPFLSFKRADFRWQQMAKVAFGMRIMSTR